jgi:uncharacterized membrane protein
MYLTTTQRKTMASLRSHIRIDRPAEQVWKLVADPAGISTWFPGIETATADSGTRSCTLAGGVELREDIVNVDAQLRRFQYRITEGMPVEYHLGTVDVLEDGPDRALVVYSTEISPESVAELMQPAIEGGVQGLKARVEQES